MLADPRSHSNGRKPGKLITLTALLLAVLSATAGCGGSGNQALNTANSPAGSTPRASATSPSPGASTPTPAASSPAPPASTQPPGSAQPPAVTQPPAGGAPAPGGTQTPSARTGDGSGTASSAATVQAPAPHSAMPVPSAVALPEPRQPATSPPAARPSAAGSAPAARPSHSSAPAARPSHSSAAAAPKPPPRASSSGSSGAAGGPLYGLDVSAFQGAVNWSAVAKEGAKFAFIKATEGSNYINPEFAQQYEGAFHAGIIRGAYTFAHPNESSGVTQANYFADHGGAWSADGKTLPGALDIEPNPDGAECYGLSQSAMRSWINSFLTQYHARTRRWPVIYTTTIWWEQCTANWAGPSKNDPLWIAHYFVSAPGALPAGYPTYTFWQYSDTGKFPGDPDVFNGSLSRLEALADNT